MNITWILIATLTTAPNPTFIETHTRFIETYNTYEQCVVSKDSQAMKDNVLMLMAMEHKDKMTRPGTKIHTACAPDKNSYEDIRRIAMKHYLDTLRDSPSV